MSTSQARDAWPARVTTARNRFVTEAPKHIVSFHVVLFPFFFLAAQVHNAVAWAHWRASGHVACRGKSHEVLSKPPRAQIR